MSIWIGFEGYKDPTEEQAIEILTESVVVLDANVLIDLYSFSRSAQNLALDALAFLGDRLFIPHQAMREFWRNRQAAIAESPIEGQPLDAVKNELLAIVNSLRPDRERTLELDSIRNQIELSLDQLKDQINTARGEPLDKGQILRDNTLDPVIQRLEVILEGRVGPGFGAEEKAQVELGLERFKSKTPPGYMDGDDKKDQVPERGTGDYLLWEQTLRFVEGKPVPRSFALVTSDAKADWRTIISKPKKQALGVRPELVAEVLERTGAEFILLDPRDFYRLINKHRSVDTEASHSLATALEFISEGRINIWSSWTHSAYQKLLAQLGAEGYHAQANAILYAAKNGGFARRSDVYDVAGYSDDRSLRRFSMPAQRIAQTFVDMGILHEDVDPPLQAHYEGPGKLVSYEVPNEFVGFATADLDAVDLNDSTVFQIGGGALEGPFLAGFYPPYGLTDRASIKLPQEAFERWLAESTDPSALVNVRFAGLSRTKRGAFAQIFEADDWVRV